LSCELPEPLSPGLEPASLAPELEPEPDESVVLCPPPDEDPESALEPDELEPYELEPLELEADESELELPELELDPASLEPLEDVLPWELGSADALPPESDCELEPLPEEPPPESDCELEELPDEPLSEELLLESVEEPEPEAELALVPEEPPPESDCDPELAAEPLLDAWLSAVACEPALSAEPPAEGAPCEEPPDPSLLPPEGADAADERLGLATGASGLRVDAPSFAWWPLVEASR
jgi:hypothetical protein